MTEEKLNGLVIHDVPSKELFDELVKRGVIGEHDISFVEEDAVESLGISGASVGQVPIVNSVDENGVPNGWGAGDLPSGGGDEWRLIDEITIEEAVSDIVFTQDSNGNPINLKKVAISLGNVSNGSEGYEDKALGVRVWIYRTVGSSYPNTQFVLSPYTTGNPYIEGSISKGGCGCLEISVGALVNLTSTFLSAKACTMSTPPIGSTIRQVALGTVNSNANAYGVATKIRIMGVDA